MLEKPEALVNCTSGMAACPGWLHVREGRGSVRAARVDTRFGWLHAREGRGSVRAIRGDTRFGWLHVRAGLIDTRVGHLGCGRSLPLPERKRFS